MKPLNLEDLKPQPGKFYLKKYAQEFVIRPLTLADDAWMREVFGEKIEQSMQSDEGMCRLVYRLMSKEDKEKFSPEEIEDLNEDGEPIKTKIGGWKKLMASIEGLPEKVLLARALLQTRGISAPVLDDIVKDELKKKENQASLLNPSAGEQSLTPSHPNMDGAGSTFGDSQGEKSA